MKPSQAIVWRSLRLLLAVLVIVGLLAATQPAFADYTIEQRNFTYIAFNPQLGQSFTATQAGFIDRLDLYLFDPAELTNIQFFAGNQITGTPLWTLARKPFYCSNCWISIPINPPIYVSAAAQYTFYLNISTSGLAAADETYSGGGAWFGGTYYGGTYDLAFVISVVDGKTLTVTKGGAGAGKITSSPGDIACTGASNGDVCSALYAPNAAVTLTAEDLPGGTFAGWTGPGGFTSPDRSIPVTMDSSKAYTATFNQIPYTLAAEKAGAGSGTVTRTPDQETYLYNDSVTLKAQAAAGSTFAGWAGPNGFTSADAEITVKVTANATYTAAFTQNAYTLVVASAGTGGGTATRTPDQETYVYDQSVTLKATPAAGSAFAIWTGPDGFTSTDAEIAVKITASATYTAIFTQIPYTLTAVKAGAGSGTVTKTPEQETYVYDQSVTLKATPAANSTFAGWSGPDGFTSTDAEITVKVTASASYTATFNLTVYRLTVQLSGSGKGAITSMPAGIDCSAADTSGCSADYPIGARVELTAAAGQNATFMGWGVTGCGGAATCTVTMDQDTTITPRFAPNADLAISASYAFMPNDQLSLTVVVRNLGPSDASGAPVTVALPQASGDGWTWTCEAADGASCPASGETSTQVSATVDLPAQGKVTFTVRGALAKWNQWAVSADVTAPDTVYDADASNNHAAVQPYQLLLPFVRR